VVVFLTGVGARTLLQEAERQGKLGFLVRALSQATVVCRGPKPTAAIKACGLSPSLVAPSPYTSHDVLGVLERTDLNGVDVTLVHYGERSDVLADRLSGRGARLDELCLYEWRLPEDITPMQSLIVDVFAGDVDVAVFTSQIQGRHLLQVAGEMRQREALVDALNSKTVVAAVGPICCAALQESGVIPRVVPTNPKMGPLIANLAEYWANTRGS
jgi:uroporphyrinogen-III synthase